MELILLVEDVLYIVNLKERCSMRERTGEVSNLIVILDEALLTEHSHGSCKQILGRDMILLIHRNDTV